MRERTRRTGFTLIELLVVIAIIVLLIAILLPALAAARRLGYKMREMAAGEQKMVAFEAYTYDYKEAQFIGYAPWTMGHFNNRPGPYHVMQPDPWHLHYYSEGNAIKPNGLRWMGASGMPLDALVVDKATANDFRSRPVMASVQGANTPPTVLYDTGHQSLAAAMAYHPSLGYNASMVGGSANRSGFPKPAGEQGQFPNGPKPFWHPTKCFYTQRSSQVFNPDRLIVWGSARGVDIATATGYSGYGSYGALGFQNWTLGSKVVPGYWEIFAPKGHPTGAPYTIGHGTPQASNTGWLSTSNRFNPKTDPRTWGFLDFRHEGQAIFAMADGHVDALKPDQARDMRRWANRADRADYNFTPP